MGLTFVHIIYLYNTKHWFPSSSNEYLIILPIHICVSWDNTNSSSHTDSNCKFHGKERTLVHNLRSVTVALRLYLATKYWFFLIWDMPIFLADTCDTYSKKCCGWWPLYIVGRFKTGHFWHIKIPRRKSCQPIAVRIGIRKGHEQTRHLYRFEFSTVTIK